MDELIERNYQLIVKRGLINDETEYQDFIAKLWEEIKELEDSFPCIDYIDEGIVIDKYEIADIILVCLNMARHYRIDIEKVLNEKITINEQRND